MTIFTAIDFETANHSPASARDVADALLDLVDADRKKRGLPPLPEE